MAADLKHEQVLDALVGKLEEATGAPHVERLTFYPTSLDGYAGRDFVLIVRPGDEDHEEQATGLMTARMETFILVARAFGESDETKRADILAEAVQAVLTAILADVKLGLGSVIDNAIDASEPLRITWDFPVAGQWAVAEMRTVIRYHYPSTAP